MAEYAWYEMTFYIYSDPDGHEATLLFCFDSPAEFQTDLIRTLDTARKDTTWSALAVLQSTVVSSVVKLYDKSVWSARDYIRNTERVGLQDLPGPYGSCILTAV